MCWGRMMGMFWEKALESKVKGKRKWGRPKKICGRHKWRRRARVLVWRKGFHKSSEMESGSWTDCCQSGVNPVTLIYRDKLGSKLDDDEDDDDFPQGNGGLWSGFLSPRQVVIQSWWAPPALIHVQQVKYWILPVAGRISKPDLT